MSETRRRRDCEMRLREAVDGLYATFAGYRVDDFQSLSCFDFGPGPSELTDLTGLALRALPQRTVRNMEFFAAGWDSWGSEHEVKHFLPRILELVGGDLEMLEGPGTFSLFKFKLRDVLASEQHSPRPLRGEGRAPVADSTRTWPSAERNALAVWTDAVLRLQLNYGNQVSRLLEAVFEMGVTTDNVVEAWSDTPASERAGKLESPWRAAYSERPSVLAKIADVLARL